MGVINLIRGRDHSRAANLESDYVPSANEKNVDFTDSGSSRLSLEERNEKEVVELGGQVTAGAQLGVQKAEAAALVWSKKAVYLTYGW